MAIDILYSQNFVTGRDAPVVCDQKRAVTCCGVPDGGATQTFISTVLCEYKVTYEIFYNILALQLKVLMVRRYAYYTNLNAAFGVAYTIST